MFFLIVLSATKLSYSLQGTSNWHKIKKENYQCAHKKQSPININTDSKEIKAFENKALEFSKSYSEKTVGRIENNGHSSNVASKSI